MARTKQTVRGLQNPPRRPLYRAAPRRPRPPSPPAILAQLLDAIRDGDHDQTLKLTSSIDDSTIASRPNGVVSAAALCDWPDVCAALAERGAPLDRLASCVRNLDALQTMLDLGADIDQSSDREPLTPVARAVRLRCPEAVALLASASAHLGWVSDSPSRSNTAPLCIAAQHGDLDLVDALLDLGAPASSLNDSNFTEPLNQAARYNHIDVVRRLLTLPGINVHTWDEFGATPLGSALENRNDAMIDLLIAHGADPSVDCEGGAPLVNAIGDHALLQRLLTAKRITKNTSDALTVAVRHDDARSVSILVQHGFSSPQAVRLAEMSGKDHLSPLLRLMKGPPPPASLPWSTTWHWLAPTHVDTTIETALLMNTTERDLLFSAGSMDVYHPSALWTTLPDEVFQRVLHHCTLPQLQGDLHHPSSADRKRQRIDD